MQAARKEARATLLSKKKRVAGKAAKVADGKLAELHRISQQIKALELATESQIPTEQARKFKCFDEVTKKQLGTIVQKSENGEEYFNQKLQEREIDFRRDQDLIRQELNSLKDEIHNLLQKKIADPGPSVSSGSARPSAAPAAAQRSARRILSKQKHRKRRKAARRQARCTVGQKLLIHHTHALVVSISNVCEVATGC